MNKNKIWLSSPHMGESEQAFVKDAFDTNWIAPLGPHVNGFEEDICNYTGAKHAAALSSGTAAIHLALIMLDLKPGDEVICSTFTFSASANPIVYQGATPVFVDSEEDTWNMDPQLLEKAIVDRITKGKKPKAVILVHLYGNAAKMEEILSICNQYDIPLIEDAAEALGASYKGKALGTFGLMGIYSFNGNKIITTSGGGALVSDNKELIDKARFLATQARDNAPHYQHSNIGYNYRLSNVLAGIGRGQMEVLGERVNQKRMINQFYRGLLKAGNAVLFQTEMEDTVSNYWLTCVLFESDVLGFDGEAIRLKLEQENIEARPLWKPMHMQPVFSSYPAYINGVSEKLFNKGLCLPSGTNMGDEDLLRIRNCFQTILKELQK